MSLFSFLTRTLKATNVHVSFGQSSNGAYIPNERTRAGNLLYGKEVLQRMITIYAKPIKKKLPADTYERTVVPREMRRTVRRALAIKDGTETNTTPRVPLLWNAITFPRTNAPALKEKGGKARKLTRCLNT